VPNTNSNKFNSDGNDNVKNCNGNGNDNGNWFASEHRSKTDNSGSCQHDYVESV
jgi:hypothetical protein